MAVLFHYFLYILGAGLVFLILLCIFDGSEAKRHTGPRRPKQTFYHRDDRSQHGET